LKENNAITYFLLSTFSSNPDVFGFVSAGRIYERLLHLNKQVAMALTNILKSDYFLSIFLT